MSNTASKPPTNAANGNGSIGHDSVAVRFTTITSVAPSPAPAATMTPSGIRWSDGRRTTTAIVATFAAAPDTTYLISATPETGASAARTARIVRGTCEIEVRAQDARRTARCTIRLRAAATWRVSITPVTGGVKGVAATKRIRVTLPIPDRPTGADGSSEPVTG